MLPALSGVAALPIERALGRSLVGISLVRASAFFANILITPSLPVEPADWFRGGAAPGMAGTSPRRFARMGLLGSGAFASARNSDKAAAMMRADHFLDEEMAPPDPSAGFSSQ